MGSVREHLTQAAQASLPRVEARLLMQHVLQREPAWLIAHDDDYVLTNHEIAQWQDWLQRRLNGEPVAYLIGEREFYGRAFKCSPAALIPRPETEHLIEQVLARVRRQPNAAPRILDVGTGTGIIAITLALELPQAEVIAVDLSPAALALAKENAQRLGAANVRFVESNWFSALADSAPFNFIVSNPPYIVPGDVHLSQGDLRFEPSMALADAVDGLESYRQLLNGITGAHNLLQPEGYLIVEHGYDQGESVPALFRAAGLSEVQTVADLAGHPRISLGRYCPHRLSSGRY